MKKQPFIIALLLFTLGTITSSLAQNYERPTSKEQEANLNELNAGVAIFQAPTTNNLSLNGNSVFIDQLGSNNDITLFNEANSSRITIQQQGFNNNIFTEVIANSIEQQVLQIGNNHSYLDFTNTVGTHNISLTQEGQNQNLVVHGENSLSEGMSIQMQGQSQSIIIRNFN